MSLDKNTGIIIKAVGGLYFVKTPEGIFECKARGIFRNKGISPSAGDEVILEDNIVISEILPRKNFIIRPPLANLDIMVFVVSTCEPSPNFEIIDKFIAVCEYKNIEPVIAITKIDLSEGDYIRSIYEKVGIKVLTIDYSKENSCDELKSLLSGKLSAFTGNSGAGKSTLLNHIDNSLSLDTGEISKKLGRGRHTTRQVELFSLEGGGFVADTPGFSTFDTNRYDIIKCDELSSCFIEFENYSDKCRFKDCAHIGEKGCAVKDAVESGDISETRYQSYVSMYNNAKQIKDWEL
ncbi:MAG: ribosome small subunit-dependent GTPase A [Oscillospiraceae bacterium]|nr:ribosome small subunit-dependent GTPase A [Oscillospiraceae bacterium]